jgi:hypothetical protein
LRNGLPEILWYLWMIGLYLLIKKRRRRRRRRRRGSAS